MLEMPFEYRDFFLLQNLVHLEISFSYMHRLDDVVKVLQNCPKLQILSITKVCRVCGFLVCLFSLCLFHNTYFGVCFAVSIRTPPRF
jgi:hypothetical protein